MTERNVKFCPDLITREERKAIAIGTGDVVISYFKPCLAEKCTAYTGGKCLKYGNDVRIREGDNEYNV